MTKQSYARAQDKRMNWRAGYAAIEEYRNLPQTLADAGYYTGLVGKYHLGRHEKPQLGFQWWTAFRDH